MASKKNTCNWSKAQETKTRETSLLTSGEELVLSGKNGKSHMAESMVGFVRMWMAGLT